MLRNNLKIIIFFSIILFALVTLWAIFRYSNGSNIEASEANFSQVDRDKVNLLLDDGKTTVNDREKITYHLELINNSQEDFGLVRVYGYLGYEKPQNNFANSFFPSWLVPATLRTYSGKNYFNYLIDLKSGQSAKANLPIVVRKKNDNQNKIYSRAYLQVVDENPSFWDNFTLGNAAKGPIILVSEDIDDLK